jgi:hypothetical protein
MKRTVCIVLVGLLALPALAQAQFEAGDWELTLSGTGNNDHDFETGSAAVSGSLGYFVTEQIEIAVRQGVVWADGGSAWNGDTRLAVDYHFNFADKIVPFVGANIGYQYGDGISDDWIAGPEIGVKFFLNTTTFIQVTAAYNFALCEGLDEGAFFYGLGIGVRL